VLIAIGNSGDAALADVAAPHLADPSPQVRAMAVWALRRLAPDRLPDPAGEADPAVRAELTAPSP
jgi:epoxyqueuosine reductase